MYAVYAAHIDGLYVGEMSPEYCRGDKQSCAEKLRWKGQLHHKEDAEKSRSIVKRKDKEKHAL